MISRAPKRSLRRRLVVITTAGALTAIGIVSFALPASAHTALQSGSAICSNGNHVVTWTINNTESNPNWSIASFNSIYATAGAQTYTVNGYVLPIAPLGSTNAMTVVPGNVTDSVVLHFSAHWGDGFDGPVESSEPVDLVGPCEASGSVSSSSTSTSVSTSTSTSTSVVTDATQGSASSTTTAPNGNSLETEGSTAVTTTPAVANNGGSSTDGAVAASERSNGGLPFTGANGFPAVIGLGSLLAGGAAVYYGKKRRRT